MGKNPVSLLAAILDLKTAILELLAAILDLRTAILDLLAAPRTAILDLDPRPFNLDPRSLTAITFSHAIIRRTNSALNCTHAHSS